MQKLLRNIFANLANLLCRVLINFGHAFFCQLRTDNAAFKTREL